MTTLAEFMIIVGADNRPPMLEKSMYDSWKSHMELYIENRENERMILNSGLPLDMYVIVNHHKVANEIWDKVKLLMQGMKLSLQERECKLYDEFDKFSFVKGLVVPVFTQGNDPISYLNKAMGFLSNMRTRPLFKTAWLLCNKFKGGKDKVMLVLAIRVMLLVLRKTMQEGRTGLLNAIIIKESGQILDEEQIALLADPGVPKGQVAQTTIPNNAAFETKDLDAYDYEYDDVSNAKAVLMANLSNYGSDVISEDVLLTVMHSSTVYGNSMNFGNAK
ncbi:hypothetical protein Tco_0860218 [Tanacetum coccineum]|uniref:Integrase, catalytic region, zinc finger, CCHC-type, peptidase aspartic, catalytic n=1 Tax=Tanacetum coccineum TaxID=301880 RepID=A0ABQ5BE88_9ASTR